MIGMTWETYCREEARECEKLARVTQGETRQDWSSAAAQWREQLARLTQTTPPKPHKAR